MTITYITSGNILSDESKAIVIPVNTMGIAGAGLARQWALQYPDEHRLYVEVCKDHRLNIGEVLALVSIPDRIFLCFPTKIVPQKRSELAWIENGLPDLIRLVSTLQIKSLALPALGCGLGGLPWRDVQPLIEKHLGNLKIPARVYLPR
ncbi:MAG: macro domain-containing protein [Anaerolineales bacterium]|nr:macro domain-containing protein [Anaerolineales bacterium]